MRVILDTNVFVSNVFFNGTLSRIITVLAEKLSALMTEEYLADRAKRGSRKNFDKVMEKVQDTQPDPKDAI